MCEPLYIAGKKFEKHWCRLFYSVKSYDIMKDSQNMYITL